MDAIGSIKLFAVTIVAAACASAQTALAQDERTPVSRAEVKAQTRAANKAHELLPAGELSLPEKPLRSSKTRTERKAETLAARKEGKLLPAGEIDSKANVATPLRSDKTRAERKAETLAAAKAHKLIPAGEIIDPARK
jgi:hypothetical protein